MTTYELLLDEGGAAEPLVLRIEANSRERVLVRAGGALIATMTRTL